MLLEFFKYIFLDCIDVLSYIFFNQKSKQLLQNLLKNHLSSIKKLKIYQK